MTIASEITRINGNIAAAYTAANNKGATIPATQNSANLATCIGTISTGTTPVINSLSVTPTTSAQTITASGGVDGYSPVNVSAVTSSIDANITAGNIKNGVTILGVTGNYSGITPSGTLSITQNGTYDVTNYASASVSVSGGGGYSEFPPYQVSNGVVNRRSGALTGNEFSGITSIGDYGLYAAFYYCRGLTGTLDLSSLTSVGNWGLYSAFTYCNGLKNVDLSSLTTVGNNGLYDAFQSCTGLTSVDLSSLTSVGNNGLDSAFYGCTKLTSIDLPSLTSVGKQGLQYVFRNCTGLTTVNFPLLKTLTGDYPFRYCFDGSTSIADVYFRALTTTSFGNVNSFDRMMRNTGTAVTHTLHFPSNLQSTISGLSGYPLFNGTSGYVVCAFDLPATS